MRRPSAAPRPALALLLALAPPLVALIAWRQVVHGYFYSDDFQTLYDLANGTLVRALFEPAFGHLNTTRNGVMGLFYWAFGPRAEVVYGAVLVVHALNAFLLYRVASRLSGDRLVAAAVAIVWAISPLHKGTLDWFAAHGHAWIATLALLMLDRLVTFEVDERRLGLGEAALWGLALIAMATSYGIGMGIAFSFPVVALVIAGRRLRPASVAVLGAALLLFAVTYVAVKAHYSPPAAPLGHLAAPTLSDMLAHPVELLLLVLHLPGVCAAALALGPLFREHAYPGWPDVVAWVAVACVLVTALRRGAQTRWLLGLLLLAFGCYPLIALGRLVANPAAPIGLALTPRYHYAPQVALALALALALAMFRTVHPRLVGVGVAAWVALLLVGLVARPLQPDPHAFDRRASARFVAQVRAAVRALPRGETVYIPNEAFPPILFLTNFQGPWKFPGLAGAFVIFFPGDEVEGRRVRFVASDPEQLTAAAATGGRITTLLVPAAPAPSDAPPP